MKRIAAFALLLPAAIALTQTAAAQDPSLGGGAVGAEAGAYLGSSFSNLPLYRDGNGVMVGELAGSMLGVLALAPVGTVPQDPTTTPPAAKLPVAQPQAAPPAANQPPVAVRVECRTISNTITVDGKQQPLTGLACKQPDGSWKLVP